MSDSKEDVADEIQPAEMSGFTILQILTRTNEEIARCREKLEGEPSGRVVAYLQGKIPGCKFAIEKIRVIFGLSEEAFDLSEPSVDMSKLSQEQILGAEIDMERLQNENELWQQFKSAIEERAENMKCFLLEEAKKSRDLDICQGKYQGMMTFEKVFETISEQAKFWKMSLFKKGDEGSGMRDANDEDPALMPPALPSPEDENEPPDEDYEDDDDLNIDMESSGDN